MASARIISLLGVLALLCAVLAMPAETSAQPAPAKKRPSPSVPRPRPRPQVVVPLPPGAEEGKEFVQADVSTRTVGITAGFSGTQVVVFGSIENGKQKHAEDGLYDVVVVLVGPSTDSIVRRKSRVAGIWINTKSVDFGKIPSYYAISSTRPIDEIADPAVLATREIGFDNVVMQIDRAKTSAVSEAELKEFRDAAVRLKERDGLFRKDDFGVSFSGRSLFRTQIMLPANVPVGPLDTNVYLFRGGEFLSKYTAHVMLEREGLERTVYASASDFPMLYGLFAVLTAGLLGLAASTLLDRARR